MIYQSVVDLVREFPVKNSAWMTLDKCFVADASDLGIRPGDTLWGIKDPWNRQFPRAATAIPDAEGEVVGWHLKTTVNGEQVECRIFND